MVIREEFLEELIELEKEIDKVVNCNSLTEIQVENFLKEFEKRITSGSDVISGFLRF